MKKIVIAVLAFELLLSITDANAQRFERHEVHYMNKREGVHSYREFSDNFNRNYHHVEFRRDFERGRIYYNQPRIVYSPVTIVQFANYNQDRRLGYYYYPGVNVYFSPFTHQYIYQYNGGWVSGEILPHGVIINEPYTQVYCNLGENIWVYNRAHLETFRRNSPVIERQMSGRPNVARPMFEKRVGNGPRGRR